MKLIVSIEVFHLHVEKCEQCRDHSLNLCPKGNLILEAVLRDSN